MPNYLQIKLRSLHKFSLRATRFFPGKAIGGKIRRARMRGMGLTAILDLTEDRGEIGQDISSPQSFRSRFEAWKKTFLGQTTNYTVESEALK